MYKFIREMREERQVNDEDIRKVEEDWNVRFPAVLKDYYLNYNGASIKLCTFYVNGALHEISDMVPLRYGELCLEKLIKDNRRDAFIPNNMIPVANNQGGDYFYWDTSSGKVFVIFWDSIDNPIPICNSLEEMFDIMNKGCVY